MKPRITYGWESFFIVGMSIPLDGWHCSGDGRRKFGATPKMAYDEWMKPSWPHGSVVEQHMCPPKPTLWQRFNRAIDRVFPPIDVCSRIG